MFQKQRRKIENRRREKYDQNRALQTYARSHEHIIHSYAHKHAYRAHTHIQDKSIYTCYTHCTERNGTEQDRSRQPEELLKFQHNKTYESAEHIEALIPKGYRFYCNNSHNNNNNNYNSPNHTNNNNSNNNSQQIKLF